MEGRIRIHRVFIPGTVAAIPYMVFPRLRKIGIFFDILYHQNLVIEYYDELGSFRIEHFHGILPPVGRETWLHLT